MKSKLVCLIMLGIGVSLLAPLRAEGATNQARNRCSDAIRILRSNPSMYYKDRDVDPLDIKNANAHWNQVIDGWNRASAQINQIPKPELDKNDPELADCFAEVLKWAEYLKQLDAKIKKAQGEGAKLAPFLESVKAHERTMFALLSLTYSAEADPLTNAKKEDTTRMLEEMAAVAKACTEQLPGAGATAPPLGKSSTGSVMRMGGVDMPVDLAKNGDAWCYVATHRVELMTKALGNKAFFAEGYGNYTILVPDAIKSVTSGTGFVEAWIADLVVYPDKFKSALMAEAKAWYGAAGIPMPPAPFAVVDRLVATLTEKIAATAPSAKFPALSHHDSRIEGGAKKSLLGIYPKAKVVKSAMDEADYTIAKNGAGIPTERYRSGQILFKLPESKWCIQRTFSYVEPYSGGGTFQKSSTVKVLGGSRFLACE